MYPTKKLRSSTNQKLILLLVGLGLNIALGMALYLIFMFAFFNNNEILLYVNSINERWFEFFLIPSVIILGIFIFVKICGIYRKRVNDRKWSIMDKTCYFGCELEDNSREELAIHYLKWHGSDKFATEWAKRYLNALTSNRHIDPICGLEYSKCECKTSMEFINRYYLK